MDAPIFGVFFGSGFNHGFFKTFVFLKMKITVTYYGQLTEITGTASETIEVDGNSASGIRELLNNHYPKMKAIPYQLAQNNALLTEETVLTHQNIEVFPPFSGG
ncbi:MAG: hypothetical protein CMC74_04510 [Flavobacteriaceae bacterium]|nr:hypothetical protein [Flavobacteriaceae bacterium]